MADVSLVWYVILLQTGAVYGGVSILTSSETTAPANSLQTSQLFVAPKLPTSICFGIYLRTNYETNNTTMINSKRYQYLKKKIINWSKTRLAYIFESESYISKKKLWNISELKSQRGHLFWFSIVHKVDKVNCCIFNRFVNNSNFLRKLFLMRFRLKFAKSSKTWFSLSYSSLISLL